MATRPTVQPAPPKARSRIFPRAKRLLPSRPRLPSLPRPDVRARATDLRYAITERVQDATDRLRDLVSDGWHRARLRRAQMSSVQVVAIVGILLVLLAMAYGWGIYQVLHPRNGNR
jgi:hypothetical protein